MQRFIFIGLGILAALTSGCDRPESPHTLTGAQRDAIQMRVTNHFAHVVMFKPVEGGFESALAFQLAPLLLQEVGTTNVADWWRDRFNATTSGPVLLVQTNWVRIHTNRHLQFSYGWNYPPAGSAQENATPTQGVRITMDSRGAPAIWEVRHDASGAEVIYVAQSVEVLARAEFGPPLPGRKFAVERAVTPADTTVVANVIDDGPVPMGPILYLQAGARDVTALICRCMPAQMEQLLAQEDYQLQVASNGNVGFSALPLEKRLRLPGKF